MTDCSLISFENADMALGKILGKGGFASVYSVGLSQNKLLEIEARNHSMEQSFHDSFSEEETALPPREQLRRLVIRDSSERTLTSCSDLASDEDVVVKILSPANDMAMMEAAITDMKQEVKLLAELSHHPNVCTLHGVSKGFWDAPEQGFLVLERLVEPLDKSIRKWQREGEEASKRGVLGMLGKKKSEYSVQELQAKRIQDVALPIARALSFLHKNQVIFRDLKPANCGFGTAGVLRLFDFGLARKVDPDYKLTGGCGTPRYMAPEVALMEDYSFPADVHSFGTFLWEICTLQKPFGNHKTMDSLVKVVKDKTANPPLKPISSQAVKDILQSCWDPTPEARPSFRQVIRMMESEVERILQLVEEARRAEAAKKEKKEKKQKKSQKKASPKKKSSKAALASTGDNIVEALW